jgi:hypothetical protein
LFNKGLILFVELKKGGYMNFLAVGTVASQIALLEGHPTAAQLIAPLLLEVNVIEADNEVQRANELIVAFKGLPAAKGLHEVLI